MLTLRRKYYDQGKEVSDTTPYLSFEAATSDLKRMYDEDPDVAVLEYKKHADGSRSGSLKGADNKIRMQYRTIV